MTENHVDFLPFHAINEFMRNDFRLNVVRSALGALSNLPEAHRNTTNRLIKKSVTIPGFRHSDKAPTFVKVIPTAKAFEKNPELVSVILAAWAESHTDLRTQIFEVLVSRGWKTFPAQMHSLADVPPLKSERDWGILPLDADRTKLPGFLAYWPKSESFEVLYQSYSEKFPETQVSLDETSLMAVWLALRLPVNLVDEEGNVVSDETTEASKGETAQTQ